MSASLAFDSVNDWECVLRGLTNQEPRAFEMLYVHLHGYVVSIALRLLRNRHDAEEVAQDVFLALWRKPPRAGHGYASLLAWLSSTTRKRCLLRFRAERRDRRFARNELRGACMEAERVVEQVIEQEHRRCLESALARVALKHRPILMLAYYECLGPPEIARRLGMPAVTVRQRLGAGAAGLRIRFAAAGRRRDLNPAGVRQRESQPPHAIAPACPRPISPPPCETTSPAGITGA